MKIVEVVSGGVSAVEVGVTGQTVVYSEMVSVVTDPTGQFVIVGWQEVIVYLVVVYTVEVVYCVDKLLEGNDAIKVVESSVEPLPDLERVPVPVEVNCESEKLLKVVIEA